MNDQHIHHALPALTRRALAFRALPVGTAANHASVRRAYATVAALLELHDVVVSADTRLTPQQRRDAVNGPHATLQIRAAGLRKVIEQEREAVAQIEDFLRHPSPAESVSDHMLDAELRAFFRSVPDTKAKELWQSMADGKDTPLLEALARFPAAEPAAVRARETFNALQRQRWPEKVRDLEDASERADWCVTIADQVDAIVGDAVPVIGASVLLSQAA